MENPPVQRLQRRELASQSIIAVSAQAHQAGSRVFPIPLNRQDLADYLFVDRSAMSNELCKMRDEGLLRFDRNAFELLDALSLTPEESDPNV